MAEQNVAPINTPISRYLGLSIISIKLFIKKRYFLPDMPNMFNTSLSSLLSPIIARDKAVLTGATRGFLPEVSSSVRCVSTGAASLRKMDGNGRPQPLPSVRHTRSFGRRKGRVPPSAKPEAARPRFVPAGLLNTGKSRRSAKLPRQVSRRAGFRARSVRALMSVMSRPRQDNRSGSCWFVLAVSVPNADGRKHGRRLIWLLSAGWYRMTKVRRGASSV